MANKEVVFDLDAQAFASDEFRIYQFKVKRCPRSRPHDWTQCPFAHPGEKAKRRDPRRYRYSGTACPEFRRNGCCRRGDACPFAHGVFECWLHPSRYRTQMCTDGNSCKRRVCFFAHCEPELRKPEDDPVWLQQQLQAELAAEQHQQQQQQAISILAALLGTQKPGADASATPANLAAQPLASLLGLKPGATPAAAAAPATSAAPTSTAAGDAQKAADVVGNLQQPGGGLTLLHLIDVLQKQQGGAPSTSAAPPAASATSDEALQAQLSKLLLGGAAPAAPAKAATQPAAAATAATRDLPAAAEAADAAEAPDADAAAPAAPAAAAPQIDVLQLLTSLAAPRTAAQAQNQNVLSAVQQLLQPTLEPTSLLAALLQQSSGGAPGQASSLVNLLQQAATTQAAAAAPAADAAPNGTPAAPSAEGAEGKPAASKPAEQDGAPANTAAPEPTPKPAAAAEPAAAAVEPASAPEKEKEEEKEQA